MLFMVVCVGNWSMVTCVRLIMVSVTLCSTVWLTGIIIWFFFFSWFILIVFHQSGWRTIFDFLLKKTSVGGNSKTLMIVNVVPNSANLSETLLSLNFSSRARNAVLGLGNRDTIKKWRDIVSSLSPPPLSIYTINILLWTLEFCFLSHEHIEASKLHQNDVHLINTGYTKLTKKKEWSP